MNENIIKQRCNALVIALTGKKYAELWWTTTNFAFDGKTPEQTELDKVYSYLMHHAQGNY